MLSSSSRCGRRPWAVTVELEFNDSATHMSNINNGSYQIASTSWGANPEPQFQLSRWSTATGGQSKWINEEYCQLVNEGISTMDDAQRLELYCQAEELLVSEAGYRPHLLDRKHPLLLRLCTGLQRQCL